ncbi:MAG: AMP-binding protein [Reyranella sp.]
MSHVAPTCAPNRPQPAVSVERPLAINRVQPAEARARTGAVASWLIAQGFGPQSAPVAILSGDSPERALFLFGALRAGVRVVSPSSDISPSGLDRVFRSEVPALVFAQDSKAYGAALDRAQARGARIVTIDGKRGLALAALTSCSIDAAVAERRLHITADTPAEIRFSDSTGVPSTHGNLVAGGSG